MCATFLNVSVTAVASLTHTIGFFSLDFDDLAGSSSFRVHYILQYCCVSVSLLLVSIFHYCYSQHRHRRRFFLFGIPIDKTQTTFNLFVVLLLLFLLSVVVELLPSLNVASRH